MFTLFVILFTLLIAGFNYFIPVPENVSLTLLIVVVALTGIPHGAIDHVIVEGNRKTKYRKFIFRYVLLAIGIIAIWLLATEAAFLLFIIISAYHFGQSQLSHFSTVLPRWQRAIMFSSWGLFVLLILFSEQWGYASEIMVGVLPESVLQSEHIATYVLAAGHFAGGVFTFALLLAVIDRNILIREFIVELAGLFSLVLLFQTTDLYLSFAVFFGVWHALRVLRDEYSFISKYFKGLDLNRFIRLLVPFSLISFFGIVLLAALKMVLNLEFSIIMLALILISALTLPHAVSMEYMYNAINYRPKK